MRVAVVGAGAAGIMAAIAAAEHGAEVILLEKNDRIGKKILATGNGRCNLTNKNADISDYHGEDPSFINYAENNFWVAETLDKFSDMGLLYRVEEDGKVYPYSNAASTVLDVLRFETERKNIKTEYGFDVESVKKTGNKFIISSYGKKQIESDKVIVTTGGKAAPASGSNGSGYKILESFGHKMTRVFPSLVQVKLEKSELRALNGLKLDAKVKFENKSSSAKASGELLFTDYGISGPVVFAISRIVGEGENTTAEIDMMPEYSFNDLVEILKKQRKIMSVADELFVGVLNKRIGQVITKMCTHLKMNGDIKKITDADIKRIASKIKAYRVKCSGTMSWNNAQVTAGGIKTEDFFADSMESKLTKGLYAAGEVLDIDGDCGGFNLQWAWSSGYIAGRSTARD